MAQKLELLSQMLREQQRIQELDTLTEQVLTSYGAEMRQQICENLTTLLGRLYGQVNANKNPLEKLTTGQRDALVGILSGAKTLKDHPESAEAFNLTSQRLKDIVARVGQRDANQMLINIGNRAGSVKRDTADMVQRLEAALRSQDEAELAKAKRELQQLWYYWQQKSAQLPATAKPQPSASGSVKP